MGLTRSETTASYYVSKELDADEWQGGKYTTAVRRVSTGEAVFRLGPGDESLAERICRRLNDPRVAAEVLA